MKLYIDNHTFHYELENLCRVFFPNDKIEVIKQLPNIFDGDYILTALRNIENGTALTVNVAIGSFNKTEKLSLPSQCNADDCEREMATLLYKILVSFTGVTPPWGILTGVRPIKLMRRLVTALGEDGAKAYFKNKLLVSNEKTELAIITQKNENKILDLSSPKSFSLYISIPFCPTRCSYCSFVSQSIEKASHLIEPYVEFLCKEIAATAKSVKKLGLKLETVYIGGGTPTTLSAEQLKRIIESIYAGFDMNICREFTIEAGRPDTVTDERLHAMYSGGVNRISINPQTLNDKILENIGRRHTAQQTLEAFELARKHGFKHINMDLIAGLPGESTESFKSTLDRITALDPESITVHTLAMKKSSSLTLNGMALYREDANRTSAMLQYCEGLLTDCGYHPYYLYRQSRMVGNLENVGWAKQGFDGLYNVYVMDETHTILACGAGGVTKLKSGSNDYLERIFNFKYPYEYINRFDEIIRRKEGVVEFYDKFF